MAKNNLIRQSENREIKRSQITFASYNPRKISVEARKLLKANMKRVGLLGGIVWNEDTGNLVSGHQKVSIVDEVNRYNHQTHENDYAIRVEVAHFDLKTEKEQNVFMNNRAVQGEYDNNMLKIMIPDIDPSLAGLNDFDLEMLGIGDINTEHVVDLTEEKRTPSMIEVDNEDLEKFSVQQKSEPENKKMARDVDFYNDSAENQIARHNEVRKIKDRILSQKS